MSKADDDDHDLADPRPAKLIKDAREARNWTQEKLAEETGIARPTITAIEGRKRSIAKNHARPLHRVLGIPLDDLLSTPDDEHKPASRVLSDHARERGEAKRKAEADHPEEPTAENPPPAPEGYRYVPVVARITAGVPIGIDEYVEKFVLAPEGPLPPAGKLRVVALRVYGDSMVGAHVLPNDIVVIREWEPGEAMRDGMMVAAAPGGRWEQKQALRELRLVGGKWMLAPNPERPEYPTLPLDDGKILGVVVWQERQHEHRDYPRQ